MIYSKFYLKNIEYHILTTFKLRVQAVYGMKTYFFVVVVLKMTFIRMTFICIFISLHSKKNSAVKHIYIIQKHYKTDIQILLSLIVLKAHWRRFKASVGEYVFFFFFHFNYATAHVTYLFTIVSSFVSLICREDFFDFYFKTFI